MNIETARRRRIGAMLLVAGLTAGLTAGLASLASANTYDDGGVHDIATDLVLDRVFVENGTTVRVLSPTTIARMYSYDESVVEVLGGLTLLFFAQEKTTAVVRGGMAKRLVVGDSSTGRIEGSGHVLVVTVEDNGKVGISDGGAVTSVHAYGSSTVDVSGGATALLHLLGGSTARVTRGVYYRLLCEDSSRADVYCLEYAYLPLNIDNPSIGGMLSGTWPDQSSFSLHAIGFEDHVTMHIVPEPLTLLGALLGSAAVAGYVRKRTGHQKRRATMETHFAGEPEESP